MTEIERCRDEQQKCKPYLGGEHRHGAERGLLDWFAEELPIERETSLVISA